jgi:hypothetical protein
VQQGVFFLKTIINAEKLQYSSGIIIEQETGMAAPV